MLLLRLLALVVGSAVFTGLVRKYAHSRQIMDMPNDRSSHTVPTPRGGGLAFVVLLLLTIPFANTETKLMTALIGGGTLVAIVGWIDDQYSLSPGVRALAHILAACWGLVWLGGLPEIDFGFTTLTIGPLGWPMAIIGIVWCINLYNFMDGIDGLAASQAVFVSLVAGLFLYVVGFHSLAHLAWMLSAVVLGFLVWNWEPAKIFMGDVASGFLGYTFAIMALASERQGALPLLAWLIFMGVFVFDATATLLLRLQRREKLTEAHRSHAYQRAVQSGLSHGQVTLGVMFINAFLAATAWVGWRWNVLAVPSLVLSILLLFVVWRRYALVHMSPGVKSASLTR